MDNQGSDIRLISNANVLCTVSQIYQNPPPLTHRPPRPRLQYWSLKKRGSSPSRGKKIEAKTRPRITSLSIWMLPKRLLRLSPAEVKLSTRLVPKIHFHPQKRRIELEKGNGGPSTKHQRPRRSITHTRRTSSSD